MSALHEQAAERFLREYAFVRRFAFYCAPKQELAEEIAHDVYQAFVEQAANWNLDADVRPILVRLTRSLAARKWREFYRNSPETLIRIAELKKKALEPYVSELENQFDREDDQRTLDDLRGCIEELSSRNRRIVEEYYWNKTSMAEIAEAMNVKASLVRQAMVRVRAKLRQCLERKGLERKTDRR